MFLTLAEEAAVARDVGGAPENGGVHIVLDRTASGDIVAVDPAAEPGTAPEVVEADGLPDFVREREAGEDRLASEAVTVRCLQRPDGSVPEADDEPDLVAWVGRSY